MAPRASDRRALRAGLAGLRIRRRNADLPRRRRGGLSHHDRLLSEVPRRGGDPVEFQRADTKRIDADGLRRSARPAARRLGTDRKRCKEAGGAGPETPPDPLETAPLRSGNTAVRPDATKDGAWKPCAVGASRMTRGQSLNSIRCCLVLATATPFFIAGVNS